MAWAQSLHHASWSPSLEEKKTNRKPPCFEGKVCICSPAGDRTYKFRNLYYSSSKKTFAQNDKVKLKNRDVVVEFKSEPIKYANEYEKALARLNGVYTADGEGESQFYYIGQASFNPYRQTFKKLELMPNPPVYKRDGEIALQASTIYSYIHKYCFPAHRHVF